mmetsp:Transcript_21937/g.45091  ORF Transcript_21937/g.45091 Transcript_21937/m.45091 type:complete len:722 (+) Transcript_21937:305-2470(+)
MVVKAKASKRSSTLSVAVVAAVWVALLWCSAVDAKRISNVNKNLGSNILERYLKSDKSGSVHEEEDELSTKTSKSAKSGSDDNDDDEIVLGNSTDYDDENEDDESNDKSYKSKGSKGSKSGYDSKSSKSSKGSKGSKSGKSDKSEKCSKSGKSSHCEEDPFTPSVSWNATFPDAVDTGFIFYDEVTMLAWYAYTAESTTVEEEITSVESNGTIATVKTTVVEGSSVTIGKICPIDVKDEGKVKTDMCVEIKGTNDTSTEIVAAETCLSKVNDSILKLAVVVEDSVASSLIVYDIVVGTVDVEVAYGGWKSIYGAPGINGQPAFTPDCKKVFATWLAPDSSVTVAIDLEDSSEIWRFGTSSRLVGLAATKDGKSLISATHVPDEDTLNAGGMVKLDAGTGSIEDEFAWPANTLRLPHNAFTNPVLDGSGNTYHIDSLLGLVKFESDDLSDGPVWSAVGGSYRAEEYVSEDGASEEVAIEIKEAETKEEVLKLPENEIEVRRLELERPRNARSKILIEEDDEVTFTAFQPALGEMEATVYGCGMTTRGDESDGVVAVASTDGDRVWHTKFDDHYAVNVGSCRGITDDIVYGPSTESSTEYAVYVARYDVIQALDAKNGTALWKYHMEGDGPTKFVVLSENAIIAANVGLVIGLDTVAPIIINGTTLPTKEPTPSTPTLVPSRAPLPMPTPMPVTLPPNASASTRGFSYGAAAMAALPLLFMLR